MKLLKEVLSSIVLALLINPIESLIVNTNGELICAPNNPTDCYPKIFEPTTEWQIIREGQDIPAGLHVRLNMETSAREAKILDPSEETEGSSELMVNAEHNNDNSDNVDLSNEDQANEIQQKIKEFKQAQGKSKVSTGDLNDFLSSVDEVQQYLQGGDASRLSTALDTLIELSHDLEFGVKLTQDSSVFRSLFDVSKLVQDKELQEKVYRIMGSSLRNNPDAVTNVLNNQDARFVQGLFDKLNSDASDVIKKRILGIIHALTQNSHFNAKYFNSNNENSAIDSLVAVFPSLESQSQTRLMNIFEDLKLLDGAKSNEKRAIEESTDPKSQYSHFLQQLLSNNGVTSENQFKLYFNKLSEVHSQDKSLKPSKEFMEWLSKEAELRSKGNHERDSSYTEEDKQFDQDLLRARHVVFGNPMGLRKALADEL
ncbi:Nucleotide exchange factor SIL1 [Debaryomyces fabryi]|uniref:Nucleotide exchange factor SIL1 n=1 Tax=Debaryomyces fabryi TaxID=58627 RepID=A0A0V1Q4X9_9ASCO|nr:Nucleotide exchange factor SIL1 [Debaryomyces fabryi]KSA03263.1 Nucleotide exchange factor SIL1 [Debaryomyces fabryi]CUM55282.1 unnamed protein product [Debaryomyces fabryi]